MTVSRTFARTAEGEVAAAQSLARAVAEAAHLLPNQAPLHAFVHHNTLHAFEHLPFEDAVVAAAGVLGTEPFQQEADFARHVQTGRIKPDDIAAVVAEMPGGDDPIFPGGPNRAAWRRQRLRNLFDIPSGQALRYLICEREATTRFHVRTSSKRRADMLQGASRHRTARSPAQNPERDILGSLWDTLCTNAPPRRAPSPDTTPQRGVRRRDELLAVTNVDTDAFVHPLLIRLCAAFLDQGIAYWSMPGRSKGFLAAVRSLYSLPLPPPDWVLRGLAKALRRQQEAQWDSAATISWALTELAVGPDDHAAYIRETLLALRGWAGMMHHLEVRPDRAPVEAPPASLMDFLAVRLVLDAIAARNVLRQHLGRSASFAALRQHGREENLTARAIDLELVFEAFVLAQLVDVDVAALGDPDHARAWMADVQALDALERRRCLHLAYERRHRNVVLDGIGAHCGLVTSAPTPQYQAVFCIDDREESLRRHLEECFPMIETYGYAGFFGAAMNYQGMEDVRPRPLCPVTVRPKHLIVERAESDVEHTLYHQKRRWLGSVTHALSVASKTLTRGGVLSVMLGLIAVIPLVLRSLFPRLAQAWSHAFEHRVAPRPRSRLLLEHLETPSSTSPTGDDLPQRGYTVPEMTAIVAAALRTMGLVDSFCPLILIVGHGSSSLNNPHEAAHDCGATGGGRGGPNARAFAIMANHPEVRKRLAHNGLVIADTTQFVGAYHNTCDDTMTYYDEHLVPPTHVERLTNLQKALAEACVRDAHERCRRFETSPLHLRPDRAMDYAQVHAGDLAEPRPEYGHATNAVCIVGRRQRTRGLFLDRRAFLVSYDPLQDPEGTLLSSLLLSVGPVGAGINLEYYFSFVDPVGYGCGTKLPHNITGLIGVMDGHATDLRTGLPWQMVEIHEPVRLLTIVEATQTVLSQILAQEAALAALVQNGWIQLVAWEPGSAQLGIYGPGGFAPYQPETNTIPIVRHSSAYYAGRREHLPPAHVRASLGGHTAGGGADT